MMSALWVAALVYAAILLGYEILLGRPELRAALLKEKCERNRDRFGELRTELMRLTREGEIDVRSEVFSVIYRSLTILMRTPGDYPRAVSLLLWFSRPRERERISATPREGKLLIEYANRLDSLCRDFDPVYRFIARRLDLSHDGTPSGEIPALMHFLFSIRTREQKQQLERFQKVTTDLRQFGEAVALA